MPALPPDRIAELLVPYLRSCSQPTPADLLGQLSLYLDLLLKWNARTNLTAVRDLESIVTRHFGESLFLASHLPPETQTVLDLGSGAGFPGLPLQLLRPDLTVTLAESQHKKAAFLREVVRSLHLSTQVHAGRAEVLAGKQHFDVVALRAVDNMALATELALTLGRSTCILTTSQAAETLSATQRFPIPGATDGVLVLLG